MVLDVDAEVCRLGYGDKDFTGMEILQKAASTHIRQLITQHPGTNRRRLSLRLCEAWGWRQANGALRDMVCRGLLLEFARAGHVELPSATHVHRNPSARRLSCQ